MNQKPVKNSEQFMKTYENFSDSIFRHCYFRISNRERAKELMQETFLKTWDYIKKGNKIKNIKSFLYKTANNLVVDEFRKKKELLMDEKYEKTLAIESGKEKIHAKVDVENVINILNSLGVKYQKVVLMRYIDELSIKEIAVILGKTENNISVRLTRAIKQLRKTFNYEQRI